MTQVYITYRGTTEGILTGRYFTQALADAAATGDDDITALTGTIDVPNNLPVKAAYYNGTTVRPFSTITDIDDTDKLRIAARGLHDLYCGLVRILEGPVGEYFPREHVDWAHDFLAYSHRGTRAVFLSSSLTTAQKLAWAVAQGLGPTDVPITNRASFFTVVATWDDNTNVPASRVLFANPADAARWTLATCKTNTALEATQNVLAAETGDLSEYVSGTWIVNIIA